jgi:antitoxin component of MazEF toxin-antitoxin module
MIDVKARTRKWGNSVGIVLPKELGFRPNEEIVVHLEPGKRHTRARDIFGKFKFKGSVEELMREIDKDLED